MSAHPPEMLISDERVAAARPFIAAAMKGGGSIDDCIRAALAAAGAVAWQPIETAPKDGTSVLVCRVNTKPEAAVQPIRTDWWSNHYEQWMKSNAYSQPTHWMPLPAPPGEARSKVERLDAEMIRRLWTLYDAAKAISEEGALATVDAWAAFHRAVANVPESARTP